MEYRIEGLLPGNFILVWAGITLKSNEVDGYYSGN